MFSLETFQFHIIFSYFPELVISIHPVVKIPNKALWIVTLGELELGELSHSGAKVHFVHPPVVGPAKAHLAEVKVCYSLTIWLQRRHQRLWPWGSRLGCRGLNFSLIPDLHMCLCKGIKPEDTGVLQCSCVWAADCNPSMSYTSPRGILQLFSPLAMITALQYK